MAFHFPSPLYPIVDPVGVPGRAHVELAEAVVAAGIRLFQLRVKQQPTGVFVEVARAVKAIADRGGAQLIINDRADIARLLDAAGVHLGQDDLPPEAARVVLGPRKVIGWSTHNPAQLEAAARAGVADYLAFGPIFPTQSKERPDPAQGVATLAAVRRLTSRPLVAIGGISAATVADVLRAGADAVAVIGAIAQAADPCAATQALERQVRAATAPRYRRRS
jgi:thiamine-phosphate diphosphorylase